MNKIKEYFREQKLSTLFWQSLFIIALLVLVIIWPKEFLLFQLMLFICWIACIALLSIGVFISMFFAALLTRFNNWIDGFKKMEDESKSQKE